MGVISMVVPSAHPTHADRALTRLQRSQRGSELTPVSPNLGLSQREKSRCVSHGLGRTRSKIAVTGSIKEGFSQDFGPSPPALSSTGASDLSDMTSALHCILFYETFGMSLAICDCSNGKDKGRDQCGRLAVSVTFVTGGRKSRFFKVRIEAISKNQKYE